LNEHAHQNGVPNSKESTMLKVDIFCRRRSESRTIPNPPKGLKIADYDGIAQLWFDDMDGYNGVFSSQNYKDVIRPDELKFTDQTRVEFLFSEETPIMEGKQNAAA
jgi:hypothetical protein